MIPGWEVRWKRQIVCRWGTVVLGLGDWLLLHNNRSEHLAWGETTVRGVPAQSDVSGFFGHGDCVTEVLKTKIKETREEETIFL